MSKLIGQNQSSLSEQELSQKCHISAKYAKTNSQKEGSTRILSKQVQVEAHLYFQRIHTGETC